MAGLSFSVFKKKILDGSKRQTIRSVRKNPIKEGETLYIWWKQRSPEREKLGEASCTKVSDIIIIRDEVVNVSEQIIINKDNLDNFAIADGFSNWQKLVEFFESTHGLPFTGVLIKWDSIKTPF
jgi:hypothetical protein